MDVGSTYSGEGTPDGEPISAAIVTPQPGQRRLLVVEDDAEMRTLLEMMLRSRGAEVTLAFDGLDAIERFADANPDAVITDLRMPHMDGLDLARHLRAAHPGLPIVLHTAYTTADDRVQKFMRIPGTSVVNKGDVQALPRVVEALLNG